MERGTICAVCPTQTIRCGAVGKVGPCKSLLESEVQCCRCLRGVFARRRTLDRRRACVGLDSPAQHSFESEALNEPCMRREPL